jgi:hypothetical protein
MTTDRRAAAEPDPQCPWLLQRIDELRDDLAAEAEGGRRRHWRRQLRLLTERARCLGCLDGIRPRPGVDPLPP